MKLVVFVRREFTSCLIILALCSLASVAHGQAINNTTSAPIPGVGHDYIKMMAETVDPANGSLSIKIATPVPSGRKMTIPFSFAYNSNGVHFPSTVNGQIFWDNYSTAGNPNSIGGGWSFTSPSLGARGTTLTTPNESRPCTYYSGYVFTDAAGARHPLGLIYAPTRTLTNCEEDYFVDPITSAKEGPYQASMGSLGSVTVAGPDGTVYRFFAPTGGQASLEDRNGNLASMGEDELERSISITDGSNFPSSVSIPGLTTPFTLGSAGVSPNFSVQSTVLNPSGCPSTYQLGGPQATEVQTAMTSLALPNGEKYQFQYDPTYGVVSKITYPSGGYVTYTWAPNTQAEAITLILSHPIGLQGMTETYTCLFRYDFYAVSHRSVSFDGVNIALVQDFTYSTTWPAGGGLQWQTKQTTVTTHDMTRPGQPTFQTIYTYTPVAAPTQPPANNFAGQIPVESSITYQDTNGAVLKTVNKTWLNQYQMLSECETVGTGLTSGTFYTYGPGDQVTDKKEYDYGLVASGTCNQPTATPTRETAIAYQAFAAIPIYPAAASILNRPSSVKTYGTGTLAAETDYAYDTPSASGVPAAPTSHDETLYGASSTAPRGNATTITRKCLQSAPACTSGNSITANTYDETGQVISTKDPNGNTTLFSYADSYTSGTPPGNTNAYLTKITRPVTGGTAHISNYSYGYNDGQLTVAKDENSQQTTFTYNDSLGRLTQTNYPDGGQTTAAYNDTVPSVAASKLITSSVSLTTNTILDGMGHVIESELTSDPSGTDLTATTYDGVGRVASVTNPYRTAGDVVTSTQGTTSYQYDAMNRPTLVTKPDGSTVHTAYCGPTTLVTDEANHWRRSTTDALGRLIEVDEPNSTTATVNANGCPGTGEATWVTTYTYDALDDLTSVTQGGSRSRSFKFDSLMRMTSSTNPEAGTVAYTYDADGNVLTKFDARPVTTTYAWDALNRMLSATYSTGDTTLSFTYDQTSCQGASACYNIGHRTVMQDGGGSQSWAYDQMGRVIAQHRHTNNILLTSAYSYNLDGSPKTMTYPSARTITYTYNSAAQPVSVYDGANNITYAANGIYTPAGSVMTFTSGDEYNSTYIYNSRLQPCWIYVNVKPSVLPYSTACTGAATAGSILDVKYNFNLGADNGNVVSIANNRDTTRSQAFTYDQVNRVLTGQTPAPCGANCWSQTFTYDQWANLQSVAATGTAPLLNPLGVNSNNRITLAPFMYDAAGNETADVTSTYAWNAESEIKTAGNVNYSYDGAGNRVMKSNGKIYWYGPGSEVLDESDLSGNITDEYVYFGGKRVAHRVVSSNSVYYYAEDMLGSSRALGTSTGTPCYDADFYPYGGERDYTNTCTQNYKFTGKERDIESGNDYFGARYYASAMGRFLSPDWSVKVQPVPYAKLGDPQSLNLYSYVRNNPLSRVDKDGHCSSPSVAKGQVGVCIDLYIQAKTINLVGQGDGRGPAANDPKATYRVELQLVIDPKAGTVSIVKDDSGVSRALGGLISNKGTDSTSPITPTTDANGTTHFTINNTALNGLHDLPGAPHDTIKTTINMDITSGGKVGIEGGERTAYPSLEIYSYNPSGQSTSIIQMQEHNPSDLAQQNQPIPQVAPQ